MWNFLKLTTLNLLKKTKNKNFRKFKFVFSILIVVITIVLFYRFLSSHHAIIILLQKLSLLFILKILFLYIIVLGLLIYILKSSLKLVDLKLSFFENLLINCYSLMINFFMFGQAGPGLRAVYLKSKFNLKIKKFFYLTALYYFFYFLISLSLIILSLLNTWYIYLSIIFVLVGLVSLLSFKNNRFINLQKRLKGSFKLFLFTLMQIVVQTIIFGLELNLVSKVSYTQLLSYSGFANISLFASITPAGIGIRESVLLLSKRISQLSSSTIVSASLIDRSIYIMFLLLVLVFLFFFHSTDIFKKIKTIKN